MYTICQVYNVEYNSYSIKTTLYCTTLYNALPEQYQTVLRLTKLDLTLPAPNRTASFITLPERCSVSLGCTVTLQSNATQYLYKTSHNKTSHCITLPLPNVTLPHSTFALP